MRDTCGLIVSEGGRRMFTRHYYPWGGCQMLTGELPLSRMTFPEARLSITSHTKWRVTTDICIISDHDTWRPWLKYILVQGRRISWTVKQTIFSQVQEGDKDTGTDGKNSLSPGETNTQQTLTGNWWNHNRPCQACMTPDTIVLYCRPSSQCFSVLCSTPSTLLPQSMVLQP